MDNTKATIAVLLLVVASGFTIAGVQSLNVANLNNDFQILLNDYTSIETNLTSLSDDYISLQAEFDDMQSDYLSLLEDYTQLHEIYLIIDTNYTDLQISYDALLVEFSALNESFVEIQVAYASLMSDYAALQNNLTVLQASYDSLLSDYTDLQTQYTVLQNQYDSLLASYTSLNTQYTTLVSTYDALVIDYDSLQADYDSLLDDFNLLNARYTTLTTWISQMILPAQYSVFAEAVRRNYFNDYILGDTYRGFTRFCRDVILHDSQISPFTGDLWFSDVSDAFSDCLTYGSDTDRLAFQIFYNVLWSWIPNWGGYGLSGNPTTDISSIVQWCCDNIDYEYDSKITTYQDSPLWDYPKFPVETAFRTFGDCEDQAILVAAYLESCGFETMMVTIHDSAWNSGSGLYHGVPMVWWNNTWGAHPQDGFSFAGDGTKYDNGWWMFLDTTWDTPFGTDPAWLQWYKDTDIYQVFNFDKFSYAVCDTDGWTSPIP